MTYTPSRQPWAHQTEALAKMDGREAFALLLAMRLGKTKVLLDDYGRLEDAGEVRNLMVIAPGGVYETWFPAMAKDLSQELGVRMRCHTWKSQNKSAGLAKRRHDFLSAGNDYPRALFMNVEALSVVPEARKMAESFLAQAPAMLAIDESTVIKGKSKRTKFICDRLAPLAKYRRILSGLPTPRDPMDLYHQFAFLDWRILGFNNFYSFRARFANLEPRFFGGRRIQVINGYHDLEHLQKLIEPHSYRKRLDEVYDLPAKMYSVRHVEFTPEQRRIYDELKAYATAQLSATEHVTATIVITQILRLHQVLLGHTVDEQGVVHLIPERRTQALLDLLAEYDGKAIIWASYDIDVRKIALALAKEFGSESVSCFWGGNRSTREADEKRFMTDPACRWMVATAAAGGRGRTWTVANLMIFFSNTNSLEHRAQAEERAQAVDKAESVAYVDLVTPESVDEKIIHALRNKIDMSSAIMGDAWREWLV